MDYAICSHAAIEQGIVAEISTKQDLPWGPHDGLQLKLRMDRQKAKKLVARLPQRIQVPTRLIQVEKSVKSQVRAREQVRRQRRRAQDKTDEEKQSEDEQDRAAGDQKTEREAQEVAQEDQDRMQEEAEEAEAVQIEEDDFQFEFEFEQSGEEEKAEGAQVAPTPISAQVDGSCRGGPDPPPISV